MEYYEGMSNKGYNSNIPVNKIMNLIKQNKHKENDIFVDINEKWIIVKKLTKDQQNVRNIKKKFSNF